MHQIHISLPCKIERMTRLAGQTSAGCLPTHAAQTTQRQGIGRLPLVRISVDRFWFNSKTWYPEGRLEHCGTEK